MNTRQQRPIDPNSRHERPQGVRSTVTPPVTNSVQRFATDSVNLNDPAVLLNLQQLIGNQAVQRMLRGLSTTRHNLSEDLERILLGDREDKFEQLKETLERFAEGSGEDKVAERQEAYTAFKDRIAKSELEETEKTIIIGMLLEGSFEWQNTDEREKFQNNFVRYFVYNDDEANPEENLKAGTLNCWETVLLIAYSARILNREQVRELYMKNLLVAVDAVEHFLGFRPDRHKYTSSDIKQIDAKPGQIVFFSDYKGDVAHVALALGGTQILSLWKQPGDNTTVQRTTIDAIIGMNKVSIAAAPWSSGTRVDVALDEAHAEVGRNFEESIQVAVDKLLEEIPSKPNDESALEDLKGLLRKIVVDNFRKLSLEKLLEKVEAVHPEMFESPPEELPEIPEPPKLANEEVPESSEKSKSADVLGEILKPYFKEAAQSQMDSLDKDYDIQEPIEDLIDQILKEWKSELSDSPIPRKERVKTAVLAYRKAMKELEEI